MRTLERPELARVLATVTDRPVGHWIAELRSPAFRAGWEIETYGGPRLCWLVAREFGRNTTDCRSAPLAITDPAEALETLCQRGVLPPSFVGDVSRWFFCAKCARVGWQCDAPVACVCKGRGEVPATLADLVAWASLGAPAIERAEDLAREAVARLAPWGVARGPRQVVWRVGEPSARGAIGWPYRDVDRTVGVERFVAGHKQTLREGDPHATAPRGPDQSVSPTRNDSPR